MYEQRQATRAGPLFLSTYEEESNQPLSEYALRERHRKKVRVSRIVTAGVVVVSAIGGLLALFSIDSTRAVIVNVRPRSAAGRRSVGAAEQEAAQASEQLRTARRCPATPEPAAANRTRRWRAAQPPRPSQSPTRWRRQRRRATKCTRLSERAQGQGRRAGAGGARSLPRGRAGYAGQSARPHRPPREPLRHDASIRTNSRRC
jgi:hypothetical protein